MAFIKRGTRSTGKLIEKTCRVFDWEYGPKEPPLYAGIYRCSICDLEIFRDRKQNFPPRDNDHHHKWQLFISIDAPSEDAEV
jgi:hypothetical protein